MRQLVGTATIDNSLLKELFMQRLPAGVKLVLASTPEGTSLDSQADMADRVLEATQAPVSAVSTNSSSLQALQKQVADLASAVAALTISSHMDVAAAVDDNQPVL